MTSDPAEAACECARTALQAAHTAYDKVPDHRPGNSSKAALQARKALNDARIAYAIAALDELDAVLTPTDPQAPRIGL